MKDDNHKLDVALSFIFSVPKNHIPLPIETERIDLKTREDIEDFNRYVVLDFETTGFSREDDEIIEVGLARYEFGKEVATYSTFVNPIKRLPKEITDLTGITEEDLQNAPPITEVVPHIRKFIYGYPIVAYNAPFDISFLKNAYERSGVGAIFEYVDALTLAKKAFPDLENHKLSTLIETFHLADEQTHRALDDVRCTQKLLELCFDVLKSGTPVPSVKKSTKRKPKTIKPSDIYPTVECIDPNNPLYGKIIVFTGELSMERSEAMQIVVNLGGIVKTAVSGKTDYLVVGTQDISIVGMDGMSSKEEKAIEMNHSGKAHINIIREDEFVALTSTEKQEVSTV